MQWKWKIRREGSSDMEASQWSEKGKWTPEKNKDKERKVKDVQKENGQITHEGGRDGGEEELLAPHRDAGLRVLHLAQYILQLKHRTHFFAASLHHSVPERVVPRAKGDGSANLQLYTVYQESQKVYS